MDLLLDTHTFLWYVAGKQELSTTARKLIEDPRNDKWVSIADAWEIAIKVSTGKIELHVPFDRLIIAQSLAEKMPVVSADSAFDAYGVTRLW